jgi:hypothetical protein
MKFAFIQTNSMNTDLLPRNPFAAVVNSFPALLLTARSDKPLRISAPVLPARPILRGNRAYLRALREAEMKAWQASGGDVFRPAFAD